MVYDVIGERRQIHAMVSVGVIIVTVGTRAIWERCVRNAAVILVVVDYDAWLIYDRKVVGSIESDKQWVRVKEEGIVPGRSNTYIKSTSS